MAFRSPSAGIWLWLVCSLGIWGGMGLVGEGLIPMFDVLLIPREKEGSYPGTGGVPEGDAELSCPGVACWDLELPGITA